MCLNSFLNNEGVWGKGRTCKARTKHPSAVKGKLEEKEFARAPPASAGASLEGTTPQSRSSSLAPHTTCRLLLALLPGAADILKARHANKQARYWQEQASLAQPALLLHLGPTSRHLDHGFQHTPSAPHGPGTPRGI